MTFIRFDRPDLKVDDLLHGDVRLTSPPEIYARLNRLIEQPNSTLPMMAEVIERDPALAARLLKLVNSAFFSLSSPVHSISAAITLLGIRELQNFVLATEVIRHFEGIPPDLMDIYGFWRQSLRCAVLARALAAQGERPMDGAGVFIAALLHGIGHLVICLKLPELERKALLEHRYRGLPLHEAQRECIGFDYAELGAALALQWRLPEMLCVVLAHHTDPTRTKAWQREVALVHLAWLGSAAGGLGLEQVKAQIPDGLSAWEQAAITPAALDAAIGQATQDFEAGLALLR
ncbi:MAG: HDOD domain-containing protein [Thiohalomonadaceae bacterium]